jgi:hypothetical protein
MPIGSQRKRSAEEEVDPLVLEYSGRADEYSVAIESMNEAQLLEKLDEMAGEWGSVEAGSSFDTIFDVATRNFGMDQEEIAQMPDFGLSKARVLIEFKEQQIVRLVNEIKVKGALDDPAVVAHVEKVKENST